MTSNPLPAVVSYKPSAYYYRSALRSTDDPHKLRALGLEAVGEMEHLKAFIRELGYIPPRLHVLVSEAEARRAAAAGSDLSAS